MSKNVKLDIKAGMEKSVKYIKTMVWESTQNYCNSAGGINHRSDSKVSQL